MTATASLLPPEAFQDGTRGRILETALRLFARFGYHGTSIREVARALKLQPSAQYVHFASKEHVLAELIQLGFKTQHDAVHAAVKAAGGDPVAQLEAYVRAHVLFHTTYPTLAVLAHAELHALSAKQASKIQALRDDSVDLLTQIIEAGVSRRKFRPPQVAATVSAIGGMGVRIPFWFKPEKGFDGEALASAYTDLALRMVSPRPKS